MRRAEDALNARQRAMWALVLAERPLILSRVRRRVDEAFVEDVTQIILARAALLIASDRADFDEARNVTNAVRGWLTVVTARSISTWRRTSTSGWVQRSGGDPDDIPGEDPTARLEAREALRAVPRGLTRRDVALLDAIGRGLKIKEVAAATGVPLGTAGTRLRKVRRYLRARVAREK
jgi:RNA polymerase sigma-70 factor (ECF subfamily)